MIPRTKLAVGRPLDDQTQNVTLRVLILWDLAGTIF
jgi:hypothetical protein